MLESLLPAGPLRQALPLFPWCLLGAGLLLASILDVHGRRAPNWLTVALLFSGVLARGLSAGLLAALVGLAGAAAALVLLFVPFKRRWLGAGDVKLLIAVGGWLGPLAVAYAALTSAMLGGIIAALWLLRAGAALRREVGENLKSAALLQSMPDVESRPAAVNPPMAPAIALGTAAVVLVFARSLIGS